MLTKKPKPSPSYFTLFALLLCLAGAEQTLARPTLAVLNFDNNSFIGGEQYEALRGGLAAMVISDLGQRAQGIQVVERTQMKSLLQQIAMTQAMTTDESKLQAGQLLGAEFLAFGSFMVLNDQIRIDLRVVQVATGQLMTATSVQGSSQDFFGLVPMLSNEIGRSLNVSLGYSAQYQLPLEASVILAQYIDAMDFGDVQSKSDLAAACVRVASQCQGVIAGLK
jgi:TolB-like protein